MGAKTSALGKRLLALTGALALGATALFGGAAAANAETSHGNIDFDADSSISVHKRTQPTQTGTAAPGTEITSPPGEALQGVTFTAQRVNYDLTDPANWTQEALDALTPANVVTTGPVFSETTDTNGLAEFTGLTPGVYLVKELFDAANNPNNIVNPAADFLVFIPMAVDGAWIYDIHVYPKNTVGEHTKTLDAGQDAISFGAGDIVTWDLSSTMPTLATGDTVTTVSVTDTLDERLAFEEINTVLYGGVALDAADWSVSPASPSTTGGGDVVFSLTESGIAKVNANSGQVLTFKLDTKVVADSITIEDGEIENGSTLTVDDVEIESIPAKTYWGNINIYKHDANDEEFGLAGAKFQVFSSEADANNWNGDDANPISINGQTVFETNAAGNLVIGPLNAGAENSRNYWVVETEAPAGFSANHTPVQVTVVAGQNVDVTYSFDNQKVEGPELPLTGATGTWMFILGGVALVAIATGVALRSRRTNA